MTKLQLILEAGQGRPEFRHQGGRLLFLPDGTLPVTAGDGGNPRVSIEGALVRKPAQQLGSHAGKLIRIREDGPAPPDNPFLGRSGARPEVFSTGHRHIQGLARHPDGRISATGNGPGLRPQS